MKHKIFLWILYLIGILFILGGAVNNGFSRFFMAIPFMILVSLISKIWLKNDKLFYFSISLIILSIATNLTQTKNHFLYPILSDGYIEILKDGYHIEFSDGSGSFITEEEKNNEHQILPENIIYTRLSKGDKFKVTGIKITHPEFGTNINLTTNIGRFSTYDYQPINAEQSLNIKINKEIQTEWSSKLGLLMLWPLFPVMLLSALKN